MNNLGIPEFGLLKNTTLIPVKGELYVDETTDRLLLRYFAAGDGVGRFCGDVVESKNRTKQKAEGA